MATRLDRKALLLARRHRHIDINRIGGDPFETKVRRSIVNIRRTLDWVVARPDVAPDRVGLVGISLGAIAGTIIMAVEPRIQPASSAH